MSRKPDPRPARTRRLLWTGLIELIQEKRWERIRVQDILDRTGVGRSTFYAHFDNKFDLLTSEIPAFTMPIATGTDVPDLLPLFEHVADMQPVMRPLMSQPLLAEIAETFERRLAEAWSEYLVSIGVSAERRTLAADILAGALMTVARNWLKGGCEPSAAEICSEFTEYSASIVSTCRAA